MNLHSAVKAAELELLAPDSRLDAMRATEFLSHDFREIGRSGRLWSRDETVAELENENDRPIPETEEWVFTDLTPQLVLVTYLVRVNGRESRHSSLWDTSAEHPHIRFHQGTFVADN